MTDRDIAAAVDWGVVTLVIVFVTLRLPLGDDGSPWKGRGNRGSCFEASPGVFD